MEESWYLSSQQNHRFIWDSAKNDNERSSYVTSGKHPQTKQLTAENFLLPGLRGPGLKRNKRVKNRDTANRIVSNVIDLAGWDGG